jgi:predicted DNA-binding antitoxin AbrB/MazE fold protein
MTTLTVEAVYENGVLRPLAPLPFPEAQKVHVQVWAELPLSESDDIVQLLVHAGLVRPRVQHEHIPRNPISTAERRRLAKILGSIPGKPLSEIVSEERR